MKTKGQPKSYFDLPEAEKRAIVEKAGKAAAKMQRETLDKYQYQLGQADLRAELAKKIEGMKYPQEQIQVTPSFKGGLFMIEKNKSLDAVLALLQEKGSK